MRLFLLFHSINVDIILLLVLYEFSLWVMLKKRKKESRTRIENKILLIQYIKRSLNINSETISGFFFASQILHFNIQLNKTVNNFLSFRIFYPFFMISLEIMRIEMEKIEKWEYGFGSTKVICCSLSTKYKSKNLHINLFF